MKQKSVVPYALLVFLFIFLITSSQTSGRLLSNKQGIEEEMMKLGSYTSSEAMETDTTDSLEKLMGVEKCESADEECMKRRAIAEAHLDYIYTQHHKP